MYLCACSSCWRTRASTCGSGTCVATRSAGRTWSWTPTGTRSSGASRGTRWPSTTCRPRSTTSGAARASRSSHTWATRWALRWALRASHATRTSQRVSKCSLLWRPSLAWATSAARSPTSRPSRTSSLCIPPHCTHLRYWNALLSGSCITKLWLQLGHPGPVRHWRNDCRRTAYAVPQSYLLQSNHVGVWVRKHPLALLWVEWSQY